MELYYERIFNKHYRKFAFDVKDGYGAIAKTKETLDKLSEKDFEKFLECVTFYSSIPCLNYSFCQLALKVFPTYYRDLPKEWKFFTEIFSLESENNA